jgi:hypothetical protein
MITECDLEMRGDSILVHIGINDCGMFDVLTTHDELAACYRLLYRDPEPQPVAVQMGTFGPLPVMLMRLADGYDVCMLIEGPDLGPPFYGSPCVGVYFQCDELLDALIDKVFPDRVASTRKLTPAH